MSWMQILADPHLHAESSRRAGRHANLARPRRRPCPTTRTLAPFCRAPAILRELGVDLERLAEQHAPAADQEQPDG